MLIPPSKGFAPSVNVHNVAIDSLAEWIEGCVTFDEDVISKTSIADTLIEQNIYREQDFAKERIEDAFLELNRRARCLGKVCPFEVRKVHVRRVKKWQATPSYSFCLMLGLQVSYRSIFSTQFGDDYTEQGVLFERLTAESLSQLGWQTHATGWSKQAAESISDKVEAVSAHIGEPTRPESFNRWTNDDAKDGGLDVICHIPFPDGWSGRPLFYLQCASGERWRDKRATPILDHWDKLIDVATRPRRGISIPFALLADEFRKAANYDRLSLLMDRHRVCAPTHEVSAAWVSRELARSLNTWTKSRLSALQAARNR